jgi:hypothetical protein
MAEGFELVRTVRQHLRRSAALLEEGNVNGALAEAESALALDPQSLSAQALRDRIWAAKAAANAPPVRSGFEQTSRSFVPYGVNAASWRGFEQRITERRFRALLGTINTSIVAGDATAARAALEEARELRPDAAALGEFEARVAAVPVALPLPAARPAARIWVRAMGAAAFFLVGVSLLLGLEWMRPDEKTRTAPPLPIVAPELPAVAPTQDVRPAPSPDLGPVPVALNEEESVPAIVTPPEPLLRPTATTGNTPQPTITSRSFAMRDASPPAVQRTIERRPVEDAPPNAPPREVSDEFVASQRQMAAAVPDAGPAVVPQTAVADMPVNADVRGRVSPPAATVASAVSIPSGMDQQVRVEEVLRRYAPSRICPRRRSRSTTVRSISAECLRTHRAAARRATHPRSGSASNAPSRAPGVSSCAEMETRGRSTTSTCAARRRDIDNPRSADLPRKRIIQRDRRREFRRQSRFGHREQNVPVKQPRRTDIPLEAGHRERCRLIVATGYQA